MSNLIHVLSAIALSTRRRHFRGTSQQLKEEIRKVALTSLNILYPSISELNCANSGDR